jgi:hypothetical protein
MRPALPFGSLPIPSGAFTVHPLPVALPGLALTLHALTVTLLSLPVALLGLAVLLSDLARRAPSTTLVVTVSLRRQRSSQCE